MNNINEACILRVDETPVLYFYTSLTNVKVNEHISFFISKEITEFRISYLFLEIDNYEDIYDSEIIEYSFNETSGFIDRSKFLRQYSKLI